MKQKEYQAQRHSSTEFRQKENLKQKEYKAQRRLSTEFRQKENLKQKEYQAQRRSSTEFRQKENLKQKEYKAQRHSSTEFRQMENVKQREYKAQRHLSTEFKQKENLTKKEHMTEKHKFREFKDNENELEKYRKTQKRTSEEFRDEENAYKKARIQANIYGNNLSDSIKIFLDSVSQGPVYVCSSCLQLNRLEEFFIAPLSAFMTIRSLPVCGLVSAGQKLLIGNVVHVANDVGTTVSTLPRMLDDMDTVAVRIKRKKAYKTAVFAEMYAL